MNEEYTIGIFPDSLTHYRVPVFNNLSTIGCCLDVYSPIRRTDNDHLIEKENANNHFHHKYNKEYRWGRIPVYQTEIVRSVIADRYDVVVMWGASNSLSHWIACLLKILLRKRTKIVMWTHGYTGREGRVKRRFRRIFYGLADRLLLYGERSKEEMIKDGFDECRLYVIYNSLNTQQQYLIYDRLKESFDRLTVLQSYFADCRSWGKEVKVGIYIGRIQKRKRLKDTVKAVKILRAKGGDFRLLIIGDGQEKRELEGIIKEEKLGEYIILIPAVYDENRLAELIMAADVAVSPGATGLLVNHALVYGIPIVTHSDLNYHGPEVEAVVDGENGVFFKRGNVRDMAAAIERAFPLKDNQDLVRRTIFDKYNLDNQKEVFGRMIDSLNGMEPRFPL